METLYGWQKAAREGRLDAGPGSRPPDVAMSLAEELSALRKQVKAQAVVDGFELRKAAILHKAFAGKLTERWRKENGIGMDS